MKSIKEDEVILCAVHLDEWKLAHVGLVVVDERRLNCGARSNASLAILHRPAAVARCPAIRRATDNLTPNDAN